MSQPMTATLEQLSLVRSILDAMSEADYVADEDHHLFIDRFDELTELLTSNNEDGLYLGQEIVNQLFLRYPQVTHLIPRELLWFFGGDCLHFMPDAEIDLFQQLEDMQYQAESEGKSFDWLLAKQKLLELKA